MAVAARADAQVRGPRLAASCNYYGAPKALAAAAFSAGLKKRWAIPSRIEQFLFAEEKMTVRGYEFLRQTPGLTAFFGGSPFATPSAVGTKRT